jgi:hypothetical protein
MHQDPLIFLHPSICAKNFKPPTTRTQLGTLQVILLPVLGEKLKSKSSLLLFCSEKCPPSIISLAPIPMGSITVDLRTEISSLL